MRWKAIRWAVATAALLAFVGFGFTSSSRAVGPVAHLEAHGKVTWVLTSSETGEVLSTHEEHVNVSAMDTCSVPGCGDRVSATIYGLTRVTEAEFAVPPGTLPGGSYLALPGGLEFVFFDGGEPGTRAVGPPNAAGIAPTADYIMWAGPVSPAYMFRAYFQSGNVQLTGSS